MTIIEQISRAFAQKHYSDRFRPTDVEGRDKIIAQNVDDNWPIFSADAAIAMNVAGQAFAAMVNDFYQTDVKAGDRIRHAIKEELHNG